MHLLVAHEVVERVVQRAQVGIDLLREVAGQEAQALARFHGRAREHDALHGAALQRVHGAGHGQVGLAGAGRADAEGDVVAGDVLQVGRLVGRARAQVGAARGQLDGVLGLLDEFGITGQHQLQGVVQDGVVRHLVEGLQQFQGVVGLGLGAVDLELLVAVGDLDAHCDLDGAQVRVGRAADVAQPVVVVGCEGVAQDHADNSRDSGRRPARGRGAIPCEWAGVRLRTGMKSRPQGGKGHQ